MTKKARNILLILGVLVLIFAGVLAYGAYRMYSFFNQMASMQTQIPTELAEPRALTGAGFVTKKDFFTLTQDGFAETIGKASQIPDEAERQKQIHASSARGIFNFSDIKVIDDKIIAVGKFGAYTFDFDGNLKKVALFEPDKLEVKFGPFTTTTFQPDTDHLSVVTLDSNHYGFLSHGYTQGVRIFNEDGQEVWANGRESIDVASLAKDEKSDDEQSQYVLEAAVGDLDGDGVSEYVVARNNDGLYAYTKDGNTLWNVPNKFPSGQIEIIDLDGDGKSEVVQIGNAIFDGKGQKLRDLKYSDSDAILFVEDKRGVTAIQSCKLWDLKITCSGESGKEVLNGPAPLQSIKTQPKKVEVPGHPEFSFNDDSVDTYRPKAVWISVRKDKPKYLAVLASYVSLPRSSLYVYEPNGNLVYQEIIGEDAETIAVAPRSDGVEKLVVGGKNTLWFYATNQ